MGTFTGRELADRKSVIRFLLMISECIGRNSGFEEESDDFLDEAPEESVDIGEHDLNDKNEKSDIVGSSLNVDTVVPGTVHEKLNYPEEI